MKITHLAAGAIVLLLMLAGYLLMQTESDKRESRMQDKVNELQAQLEKMKQGRPALPEVPAVPAAPAAVAAPAANPPPAAGVAAAKTPGAPQPLPAPTAPAPGANPATAAAPNSSEPTGVSLPPLDLNAKEAAVIASIQKMQTPVTGDQLNDLQKKIVNLPAIGKVKSFNLQHSFAVIDAGKKANLTSGMKFQVRRDAMLIGKAIIGDTIDEAEAVANIDPASIPVGVEIKPGDQLVQFDNR